jgi:hypothetical protein
MDSASLQMPVVTGLDAVTQAAAALCYLVVGAGVWVRAPRDVRARVFLALALANIVAFAVPAAAWARGITDFAQLPRAGTAAILVALSVGAILLFHFTQVLPRRRPWVRRSGVQLPIAYAVVPIVVTGLVWYFPANVVEFSELYVLAFLVFGFPLLVLLAIVLPVAAIVSLVKSYHEVRTEGLLPISAVIAWIVVSQIAGGALVLVFAPVLAVLAPNSATQAALTLIIWALGLITPIAFGVAVWKFGLLAIDPDTVA